MKVMSDVCLRCMECCKWNGFIVTVENVEDALQMYQWRGCEVKQIEGNKIFMIAPMKCRHLTGFGCSIYHTRPRWCRQYDGRTDPALRDKCLLVNREVPNVS